MAFQQPQKRPQPARQLSYATSGEHAETTTNPLALQRTSTKRTLDTSEEWVLFSPTAPSVTQTHTTSTDRTPRTAGLSRLSDFGSLDTAARSDQIAGHLENDNATEQGTDADEEAELDSLDDGLHAFHEPSDYGSPRQVLQRSGETVLPTHDGLGTFGESSAGIQWQFEREAQRRKHRRRASSVQRTLQALEEVEEVSEETERMRRIEKWRLEQSRALLEEIERETRRMRRVSRPSLRSRRTDSNYATQTRSDFSLSSGFATPAAEEPQESQQPPLAAEAPEENESFWQRVTRRVIRDLIGIDEELLSVILGEALPDEAYTSPSTSSSADITRDCILETVESAPLLGETWEHRLLERVARELGILVHQLSEHPGAFSTYLKTQETPLYACIPSTSSSTPNLLDRRPTTNGGQSANSAVFAPTLQNNPTQNDPSLWGIEEEPETRTHHSADETLLKQEREYWEREIDVKMVFNFLKNRFSSSRPNSPDASSPSRSRAAAAAYPATTARWSAQRAALIRQHHPLTSSSASQLQQRHRHVAPHPRHHHQRLASVVRTTRSESCASQSTKKSRKSGSSRNYWDLGGSVGSGPMSAGLGVWGEVGI